MIKGFHITSLETRWQSELVWDGYFEILIYKEKTVGTLKNTVNTCNDKNVKIRHKLACTTQMSYPIFK